MFAAVIVVIAAVVVTGQDITGAANCTVDPPCTGSGGVSCLYCPNECGSCPANNVYDHCVEAGTVHLSIDDGPAPTIDRILDILRDESDRIGYPIKASFWYGGSGTTSKRF
jgi:hypothetical protein